MFTTTNGITRDWLTDVKRLSHINRFTQWCLSMHFCAWAHQPRPNLMLVHDACLQCRQPKMMDALMTEYTKTFSPENPKRTKRSYCYFTKYLTGRFRCIETHRILLNFARFAKCRMKRIYMYHRQDRTRYFTITRVHPGRNLRFHEML